MRRKHVPLRTCVVCREAQAKRELVRLVRTPDGELAIDPTGRMKGRGAYLCRQKACWEAALKGGQIARALQIEIGERERQLLRDFADSL